MEAKVRDDGSSGVEKGSGRYRKLDSLKIIGNLRQDVGVLEAKVRDDGSNGAEKGGEKIPQAGLVKKIGNFTKDVLKFGKILRDGRRLQIFLIKVCMVLSSMVGNKKTLWILIILTTNCL